MIEDTKTVESTEHWSRIERLVGPFVDADWLISHGAIRNQEEICLRVAIGGRGCQLRFKFDNTFGTQWCLLPSTGDGRIWLPVWHGDDRIPRVAIETVIELCRVIGGTIMVS